MSKSIIFLCFLLFIHQVVSSTAYQEMWGSWKAQHLKTYTEEEEKVRFAIFSENINKIQEFNSQNNTAKLALNKFADLSSKEFKEKYTGCAFTKSENKTSNTGKKFLDLSLKGDLPATVDWRESGVVTEVKDQAQCGSCWTFSTTGALESYYSMRIGNLVRFSEQQIVDCSGPPNQGCDGGFPYLAFEYASINGLELEADYPYTGVDGTCKFSSEKATTINIGYAFAPPYNRDALKAAIAMTPTAVSVEADQLIFQFYSKGIVGVGCGAVVDHAVLAVGYTLVDGAEAFIVKNSWGEMWGQKGYIYISTDPSLNKGMGACGILRESVFPF